MKRANCIIITVWLLSVIQPFAIAQEEVEFVIPMSRGWKMISAPVVPADPDMNVILRAILERDNLIICKDEDGRFFAPEWEYNNMGNWNFHKGYWVKLTEADTLIITGEPVNPETPIQLIRGWNLVAYFLEEIIRCEDAFATIENHLQIAKNWRGDFYVPDCMVFFYLRPGEGYQVRVDEDVELVWPQE